MAEVKWIKLDTDIFNNRKIRQIEKMPDGDSLIVIWLKILTLAGHVNDGGFIYITRDIPYNDQLLANEFDKPVATVQMALEVFRQFGMIDLHSNILHVSNWEEYQNIDGLEKIREQTRQRVERHREKQKLLTCNATCNATVTQCNATDIEEDKDIEKEIDNSAKSRTKFSPPTLKEVTAYCEERKNGVDPNRWYNFYASKGWMVGKNKMKDWKASVRTWERSGGKVSKGESDEFWEAVRRLAED